MDPGEKESIHLAAQGRGTLLLVDEEAAREAARERGVRIKGTLGFLVEAFHKGLVGLEELEFLFAQIEQRDDIWISTELCQQVLAEVRRERRRKREKKP